MPEPVPPFKALGAAMREVRAHLGLSQARIADRAGVTPNWLSPLENGRLRPAAVTWQRWLSAIEAVDVSKRSKEWSAALAGKLARAKALYAQSISQTGDGQRLLDPPARETHQELWRSVVLLWKSMERSSSPGTPVQRRDFLTTTAKAAASLPFAGAVERAAVVLGASSVVDGAVMHAADLRRWFWHLPGVDLRPLARAHVNLLDRLTGRAGEGGRGKLVVAAGETELLLGWIEAFDVGDVPAAAGHFTRALVAADDAGDDVLGALVLAGMTTLTRRHGDVGDAADLADLAVRRLERSDAAPTIRGFVQVLHATAHAAAGDRVEADRSLELARAHAAQFTADDATGWRGVGAWNAMEFARYEGYSLLMANRPAEAEAATRRGLALLGPDELKYRCVYLANIAHALVRQGQLEAACETAAEAVRLAAQLGQSMSLDEVAKMLLDLPDHRAHPAIIDLKDQLATALR